MGNLLLRATAYDDDTFPIANALCSPWNLSQYRLLIGADILSKQDQLYMLIDVSLLDEIKDALALAEGGAVDG